MPAVQEPPVVRPALPWDAERKGVSLWQGRTVIFYPQADRNSPPAVAFVQKWDAKRGTATLSVIADNFVQVRQYTGVRFIDDPAIGSLAPKVREMCGAWDLTDGDKAAARTVPARVPALQSDVK